MKFFKGALNILACLCLMTQTAFASVQYDRSKLNDLNKTATVENMEKVLKAAFPTAEDHRQISYEFVKVKKLAEKWLWRYEVKGDSIAIRINGRVQAYFQFQPGEYRSFKMNGQEMAVNKGQSFLSFYKQFEKVYNKPVAKFDALFFEKAEAFWPLVIVGVGLFAFLASKRSAHASTPDQCNDLVPAGAPLTAVPPRPVVKVLPNWRKCSKSSAYTAVRPLSASQVRVSAQNFKIYCSQHPQGCGQRANGGFSSSSECAHWKTHNQRHAFGHNLNSNQALQLCRSIEAQVSQCMGGAVVPSMPVPPQVDVPNDSWIPVQPTKKQRPGSAR